MLSFTLLSCENLNPNFLMQWGKLERSIRGGELPLDVAKREITKLNSALAKEFKYISDSTCTWVFPLEGYNSNAIGGENGSGYLPDNYSFYDGNRHRGHPAHDIFIRDRDQDCLSDETSKPVNVLSVANGIVISVNADWDTLSNIRGGKYVWIFDPHNQNYFYYAHLDQLFVTSGDILIAGQPIGTVGRTGLNAYKRRSPTHLHFMCLSYNNGDMTPINTYDLLTTASLKKVNSYTWLNNYDVRNSLLYRIKTPKGYKRVRVEPNSFSDWLRYLPLKPGYPAVCLYNGREKYNQDAHCAVVDIDIGNKDLQQCADAVMRLRAEYLFSIKDYNRIHFNFVNGFNAEYSRWRRGDRIRVSGNNVQWIRTSNADMSWRAFRKYLDIVFSWASTLSLVHEMVRIGQIENIEIGDVFIQGGSPGHAIIVVDMAENMSGDKLMLLAQSYMPAQDVHILKNPNSELPWYDIDFGDILETPEWRFRRRDLHRFGD
jgi:hypothetical protein